MGVTPDDKTVYYFAGIDAARFKRPVEPGDQLIHGCRIAAHESRHFQVQGCARGWTASGCEAELMCTMRTIA
jgi:3-hydroxyacyl-[acyl-carrier-protein] dehydratase